MKSYSDLLDLLSLSEVHPVTAVIMDNNLCYLI